MAKIFFSYIKANFGYKINKGMLNWNCINDKVLPNELVIAEKGWNRRLFLFIVYHWLVWSSYEAKAESRESARPRLVKELKLSLFFELPANPVVHWDLLWQWHGVWVANVCNCWFRCIAKILFFNLRFNAHLKCYFIL